MVVNALLDLDIVTKSEINTNSLQCTKKADAWIYSSPNTTSIFSYFHRHQIEVIESKCTKTEGRICIEFKTPKGANFSDKLLNNEGILHVEGFQILMQEYTVVIPQAFSELAFVNPRAGKGFNPDTISKLFPFQENKINTFPKSYCTSDGELRIVFPSLQSVIPFINGPGILLSNQTEELCDIADLKTSLALFKESTERSIHDLRSNQISQEMFR